MGTGVSYLINSLLLSWLTARFISIPILSYLFPSINFSLKHQFRVKTEKLLIKESEIAVFIDAVSCSFFIEGFVWHVCLPVLAPCSGGAEVVGALRTNLLLGPR